MGKQAKRNKNDFLSLDLQPRPHPGSASEDVYDKSFDITRVDPETLRGVEALEEVSPPEEVEDPRRGKRS